MAKKAWNLGILVVLCGIVGAKVLYIINDWSAYAAQSARDFQHQHSAGGRSVFGRADWRAARCRLVHPQTQHAGARRPVMRSRRDWRWDTQSVGSVVSRQAAAMEKKPIISGE